MTEQELRKAIRSSAQDVEVPEQLMPEVVEAELATKKSSRHYPWKGMAAVAAVLVLAVGAAAVLGHTKGRNSDGNMAKYDKVEPQEDFLEETKEYVTAAGEPGQDAGALAGEPKQDAGEMFTVAKSYEQVYARLEEFHEISFTRGQGLEEGDAPLEAAADSSGAAADGALGSPTIKETAPEEWSSGNQQGYSRTNVQTAGVDESDVIKTDGRYVYTVGTEGIVITDISGGHMSEAARIRLEDPAARVMEMYVQGDVLNLIVEQTDSGLEQLEGENGRVMEDAFFMDSKSTTHLLTYDISDRKHPVLAGEISQDGTYYTSRKIGSVVYLFTTKYELSDIPQIGGKKVPYDCIYLPERGRQGLLVASVNVKKPTEVLDHVMVVNDYVEIYVSTGAMYLYQYTWQEQNTVTQIAKFTLEGGAINAVGSASVKGRILDTFAIQEGNGQLRVLTTDWGVEEETNNLYVLDKELKLTGSLQGLAAGEQIYAARFLGNTAYFVTYRNTDPLFAVDLTNPEEPRVLSELKITGFSEYLHFWGTDKLLGIGYETDPDTGDQEGIKLTMFDISDPAELQVLDSVVLKDLDQSPAMYAYKSVLADSSANLFGFVGVDYQGADRESSYYLYQWGEDGFERLLKAELGSETVENNCRGLYSGMKFYLADPAGITSYDREKGYEKIESLEY